MIAISKAIITDQNPNRLRLLSLMPPILSRRAGREKEPEARLGLAFPPSPPRGYYTGMDDRSRPLDFSRGSGINDDRKKILWPWVVAVLIGLPVLYVASLGPLVWLITRDLLPEWSAPFMNVYTAPLNWAVQSQTVRDLYIWYTSFWVPQAPRVP